MSIFVFLGPTLAVEHAQRELPAATFLPPARRGDLLRVVVDHEPAAIGLIDGLFDSVPAVVHKEILFALSEGVQVFGSSSMGALRAAELWPFGMQGIGRIYENYKSGTWDADDEVAVVHGPASTGFAAASVALANLRLGIEAAETNGVIGSSTAQRLVEAAAGQFYADRSWASLYDLGAQAGLPGPELHALRAFVSAQRPDAKRDDALALLRHLRVLNEGGIARHSPTFDFEATIFWERLVQESPRPGPDGVPGSPSALQRHLQLRPDGHERIRGAALLYVLSRERRRGTYAIDQQQLQAAVNRLRRRNGLVSSDQIREWLAANDTSQEDLATLAELDLTLEELLREAGRSLSAFLELELKRRGEFGDTAAAVAWKERELREAGVASLALQDVGLSFPELMTWYQTVYESVEGSIDGHAKHLGFESVREFLSELLLEHRLAVSQSRPGEG
jgi:hypothetical protein